MSADEYTRSFHVLALTIGSDIFFRNGAYKPETEGINPLIMVILKNLYLKKQSAKEIILEFAKESNTEAEFIEKLKNQCNIEYSSYEKKAQILFGKDVGILKEYITEYENEAATELKNCKNENNLIAEIKPLYKQINVNEELPSGLSFMKTQPEKVITSEKITIVIISQKLQHRYSIQQHQYPHEQQ